MGMCCGMSNTFRVKLNGLERDSKNEGIHDKDCVEQEFQFQFFRNCEELLKVVK